MSGSTCDGIEHAYAAQQIAPAESTSASPKASIEQSAKEAAPEAGPIVVDPQAMLDVKV